MRVKSPRSLLRQHTENMYLPRHDKFEGYSQFPRPRLPPETKKLEHKKAKGEIFKGPMDRIPRPLKEVLAE